MPAIHQQVRRTIRRHGLCPPGTRLLVALSGGSDSVALTLLLRELAPTTGFTVEGLAHFNHRLRPTSQRDESFCRELAARLGLPLASDAVDVRAYATSEGLSLEDAARRARYTFLHRAAGDLGADRIAVGHTRDDQAETFLLKLIRGAGLSGLGGVHPRRGIVVRPLLDVSRAELREYLTGLGEGWVEDESNELLHTPRNRIRHKVLPELDAAYGGGTRASIARAARLAREDGEWLDELAAGRLEVLGKSGAGLVELDARTLTAEPAPLRRRVLLSALRSLSDGRQVELEHVETALEVLGGSRAGADLPGCRVELRRGKLVLLRVGQVPPAK